MFLGSLDTIYQHYFSTGLTMPGMEEKTRLLCAHHIWECQVLVAASFFWEQAECFVHSEPVTELTKGDGERDSLSVR